MNDSTDINSRSGSAPHRLQSRSSIAMDPLEDPRQAAAPRAVRPLHSLALQVPLLLVVALSLVISAGAWGLRTIVLRSFERLEVANAELDLRRFANAVDYEVSALNTQLAYAIQHDRQAASEPFDVLPLDPRVATVNSPQLACIFDGQGALTSTDSDDPDQRLFQLVNPIDFCSGAEGEGFIAQALAGSEVAGLHHFGETFFVAAAARLPADSHLGEAGGVMLLARHISPDEIDALAQRMAINIDFWSMDTPNLDILEAAAGAALTLGAPIIVNKHSENLLQVYWAFRDANGEPGFLARANVFRDLREIADETVLLSVLSMGGVGLATILLSLVLVRALMVKRLSRLTQQLLGIRRGGLGGQRLRVDQGVLGQQDEISVLAEEFDNLLSELAVMTQQLADVSYRAGRAEVTEGSLHNIGNALNSLLASADAAQAKLRSDPTASIAKATQELADSTNLTERQGKLVQFTSLASAEIGRRYEALKADISRVMLHVSRIEDILESQRRMDRDGDLAEATQLLPLVKSSIAELPNGTVQRVALQLEDNLSAQLPVVCIRAITQQVLSNLLTNAVEAIARAAIPGGRVRISASTVDVEGVRMVELCLADNGAGLDASELVKIFQRHYTTKQGRGHGIGLHWSANVIASMGGQLYARSPGRGKGASLHLRLPAAGT
jgi:signal transduction histidine kinase